MAPGNVKVLLVGATGETGASILDGLLEAKHFDVTALVRHSSLEKLGVRALKDRDVNIRVGSADDEVPKLVAALEGIDILISAIGPEGQLAQFNLAEAAKKANVKRFIPCAFTTVAPPGGVMLIRDEKEEIYQHIRKLYLPYTIIDVGFWSQISFPPLPSGRVDYALMVPFKTIYGDGEAKNFITDLRDVGRYVAKIIVDERTLNKMVVTEADTLSQNEIFAIMEELSEEKIAREYVTAEILEAQLVSAKETLVADPKDSMKRRMVYFYQYAHSKYIRGDNSPEHAAYLGYLNTKDLYPDFKYISFKSFVKEDLLEGKAKRPYADI